MKYFFRNDRAKEDARKRIKVGNQILIAGSFRVSLFVNLGNVLRHSIFKSTYSCGHISSMGCLSFP